MLERLPQGMFRDLMYQALYERIGYTPSGSRASPRHPPAAARARRSVGGIPPVRRAVALVVQYPELALLDDLPTGWEALDSPGIGLLGELIAAVKSQPEIRSGALVERWDDAERRRLLAKLAVIDLGILDDAPDQFAGTLRGLAQEQRRAECDALLTKSRHSPLSESEKQRLRELLRPSAAE
jgi:DNA primase